MVTIQITSAGPGIGSTLEIWTSGLTWDWAYFTSVSKTILNAGYTFEPPVGATDFLVMDNNTGTCGTIISNYLNCAVLPILCKNTAAVVNFENNWAAPNQFKIDLTVPVAVVGSSNFNITFSARRIDAPYNIINVSQGITLLNGQTTGTVYSTFGLAQDPTENYLIINVLVNLYPIDQFNGIICTPPTTTTTTTPIPCGATLPYSGGPTYPTVKEIYLGTSTGVVTLNYNMYDVPDRARVIFDGNVVIDTGYRGESTNLVPGISPPITYNQLLHNSLAAIYAITHDPFDNPDGPTGNLNTVQGPGLGTTYFNKTTSTTVAYLYVYGPINNPSTVWNVNLSCPVTIVV